MGQWRVAKIPALHNNPWGVSLRWMFEFVATTKVTMNRPMFCVFCIDIHYHCSTLHASQSQAFSYNFKESMCFSFRWDFLYGQEENLASFRYLRRHGTFMPMVRPVFPPEDYPVWTSMATGSGLYLFA